VIATTAVSGTTATQTCPGTNPNVVSGGFNNVTGGNGEFQIASYPSASNAWTVTLNDTDAAWNIYAVCAK
jgi:hypothetical protein